MSSRFETTHWSIILAGRDRESPRVRFAMEYLCEAYWYPLYAFVRRQGYREEEARDLTQAFFLRMLDKHIISSVAEEKGRFRSFLLASMKNFLSNERARASAQKRAPETPLVSLDADEAEERYRLEPADHVTPDEIFERRWAATVVERARRRLAEEQGKGKEERFRRLEPYLGGSEKPPYAQIAQELGVGESAVRVALHRLRKQLGIILREEIAATVSDPATVEDELRQLLEIAAKGS